mmetsp:Transcript_1095/g.3413  ORF Transcript_1095/g.3413 Transcript_1095/m.3413 type:complete len:96 (+) Transcript_1095:207-494(+)
MRQIVQRVARSGAASAQSWRLRSMAAAGSHVMRHRAAPAVQPMREYTQPSWTEHTTPIGTVVRTAATQVASRGNNAGLLDLLLECESEDDDDRDH